MNPMDTINMFCSDDFLKSVPGLAKEKEVDSSLPGNFTFIYFKQNFNSS